MSPEILLIVSVTAVIQSLFGAGVLLFGTPLLLLLGYPFIDLLIVLLPVSLTINTLQILKHHAHIDFGFYRKIVLLTLPPIGLFLFWVTHYRLNIAVLIGLFLLIIALKEFSSGITRLIDELMRYETAYFVTMGIVHGLSNLGGSLLTALVHHKNYDKDVARVTISACYGTFALLQLTTLWLFNIPKIAPAIYENVIYLTVGALVFAMTDETLYTQIDREKYRRIFAGFLGLSGLVLIVKGLS